MGRHRTRLTSRRHSAGSRQVGTIVKMKIRSISSRRAWQRLIPSIDREGRHDRLRAVEVVEWDWTEEELALIGTDCDRAIGRKEGKCTGVVQRVRIKLGIPGTICHWTEEDHSWLGTDTDCAIAEALGRTEEAVRVRRK
jgi:hypothetical protein